MLIRQITGFFIAAGIAFGAGPGVDPKLMNLVMPDAKILAGVNVTSAKTSPLGQFVIAQVQGNIPQLQGAIAATGFDPFTDVSELLMASAANAGNKSWLLLMDGTFKVDQIVAVLKGQNVQNYAGATLITFAAPGPAAGSSGGSATGTQPSPALAFLGAGSALAGDVTSVKAALDRASGTNAIDPGLAARVNTLSVTGDAWLASIAPLASLLAGAPAVGGAGMAPQVTQMLSNVVGFSGAINLGANVQVALQAVASSDKNAEALGDVARLVISLGAMDLSGGSQGAGPQVAGLFQLLQQLQVTTSGSDVNLALVAPEAQIESLLKAIALPGKPANGN